MINLSRRIKELKSSPTLAFDAKVKRMKKEGIDVVNLTAGEPDFSTPDFIKTAAKAAIDDNFSYYTPVSGYEDLRAAIAQKLLLENNIKYDPTEIIVGVGSKQILYLAFQALCEKGDEVIIPIPTWSTYIEQVKLTGAKPVLVKLNSPFKLKAQDIQKHLTAKTKAILFNSPSNPTGAVIDKKELMVIADLAVKKNIFIITDEVYEKIIFQGKHVSIASLNSKIKEQTMTINGFSKAYAMTGWRVGYGAGPKKVIDVMSALTSQMTSSTSSISQRAALAALSCPKKEIDKMVGEFKKRREFVAEELAKIVQISFTKPEGAFYFFINIKKLLGRKYKTSDDWTITLLEKGKVGLIPGDAFCYPGYVRMSFAASINNLKKGLERIKKFINEN